MKHQNLTIKRATNDMWNIFDNTGKILWVGITWNHPENGSQIALNSPAFPRAKDAKTFLAYQRQFLSIGELRRLHFFAKDREQAMEFYTHIGQCSICGKGQISHTTLRNQNHYELCVDCFRKENKNG